MIKLKHDSGVVKECPTGYSWTTLLFGCFVPLFRGDIKWAAILFAIVIIAGSISVGVGGLIANAVFAALYNEMYIKDLLQKGYKAATSEDREWLIAHGIVEDCINLRK